MDGYEEYRSRKRAYLNAWRANNKEKCRQYRQTEDPELGRERSRRTYASDPEHHKARAKAYRELNPEAVRRQAMTRRARINNAFVEIVDPQTVFNRDKGICQLCNLPVTGGRKDWHVDHVIPLVAGGEHSYDNTQLAHASCNLRKARSVVG